MICVTSEGSVLSKGINFYPLSEFCYSIGFRIKTKNKIIYFRYAPKVNKLYFWHTVHKEN
jgi:hypothetical protein